MPLAPGQLLRDRYRIDALLGQGGMGAVYDVHDNALNIRCAVKENMVLTEAAQRQFEHEAQLLAKLRHNGLPRVIDHFVIPGQGQYLVMDFVEGKDLRDRLREAGTLPEAEVLRWADEVLDALAYLHRRGIIHRDIKPANIKITPEDEAVLVDFGIAKESGVEGGLTTTGARGLTPGFAPPEQYGMGHTHTDARSDLYALGATLYALLTGKPPAESLARLLRQTKFAPLTGTPGMSPALAAAIDRALETEPDQRFASAEAMKAALHGAAEPASTGLLPAQPEAPTAAVEASAPATVLAAAVRPAPPPQTPAPAGPAPAPASAPSMPAEAQAHPASALPVTADNPAGIAWVEIPAGEFLFGPDSKRRVIDRPYRIGRGPVSQAEYRRFIDANPDHPVPFVAADWALPFNWDIQRRCPPPDKLNHPVVLVSWNDAEAFCKWALCRLPTEEEWEKAARGTDGRDFPWGSEVPTARRCNFDNKVQSTTAIGMYSPHGDSPYGCVDMAGNVLEWTSGKFDKNTCVVRGGAWNLDGSQIRLAIRGHFAPGNLYINQGFRCVALPAEADKPAGPGGILKGRLKLPGLSGKG